MDEQRATGNCLRPQECSRLCFQLIPFPSSWSFGFGLGYSITRALDLKAMMLMPGINHTEDARNFGAGVGIQVRIE